MDFVTHESTADELGAIEHQLYPVPFVNMAFAGKATDPGAFRHRLWNAAMDGDYVTAAGADAAAAAEMKIFFEFFADNRHWELEPFFDVDGGRAMALEDVEYILYVENPAGPVEVLVEHHGYEVVWLNPANGETVPLKGVKTEKFAGEPPDRTHDWVLHISREGHKQGMLKSYKFESRRILLQDGEVSANKVPFQVVQPSAETISLRSSTAYAIKLTRVTHATRSVMYLWTGEIAAELQGYHIIGTGEKGAFQIPANIAQHYPAALHVRLFGMNANGKVYSLDRTYQLTQ